MAGGALYLLWMILAWNFCLSRAQTLTLRGISWEVLSCIYRASIHFYLLNVTWLLLQSIRTVPGSGAQWMSQNGPHGPDSATGTSSITKSIVPHVELSGPRYMVTRSPTSSLAFHSHYHLQASASHWMWWDGDKRPSSTSPPAALCPSSKTHQSLCLHGADLLVSTDKQ